MAEQGRVGNGTCSVGFDSWAGVKRNVGMRNNSQNDGGHDRPWEP